MSPRKGEFRLQDMLEAATKDLPVLRSQLEILQSKRAARL